MRIEVYGTCQRGDFSVIGDFINLLHRLKIIRRVSLNPGRFMSDANANNIGSPTDINYIRLVYEKVNAK
jgi:hypothetical protein